MIESQNMAKRKRDRACELRGRCAILREQQGDGPAVAGFNFMWPPPRIELLCCHPGESRMRSQDVDSPLLRAEAVFIFYY